MEKFYSPLSNKLPIALTLFVILVIYGFVMMKVPTLKYKLSPEEMVEVLQKKEYFVSPQTALEINNSIDSSYYQFIDLRSPHEFLKGHIDGAINIPISNILEEEYKDVIDSDSKINILYYNNHNGACGPFMVLTQLGYKNNKILLGGYNFYKKNIIDNYAPKVESYRNEKPKFDYAKVMRQISGGKTQAPPTKKAPPKVKKKAKKSVEGGC